MSMTSPLDISSVLPGFADPTRDSQTSFRTIMYATAQPGTVGAFPCALKPPLSINQAAGVCLLTLADQETKIWLDRSLALSDAASWLRFHTGAPLTLLPGEAAFALVADIATMPELSNFHQGDAKYPDRATTVIIMVSSLTKGPTVRLRGPGIQSEVEIAPAGLTAAFWELRAELVAHFQFGIDLILCAGDQIISIPRTTRVSF